MEDRLPLSLGYTDRKTGEEKHMPVVEATQEGMGRLYQNICLLQRRGELDPTDSSKLVTLLILNCNFKIFQYLASQDPLDDPAGTGRLLETLFPEDEEE